MAGDVVLCFVPSEAWTRFWTSVAYLLRRWVETGWHTLPCLSSCSRELILRISCQGTAWEKHKVHHVSRDHRLRQLQTFRQVMMDSGPRTALPTGFPIGRPWTCDTEVQPLVAISKKRAEYICFSLFLNDFRDVAHIL